MTSTIHAQFDIDIDRVAPDVWGLRNSSRRDLRRLRAHVRAQS